MIRRCMRIPALFAPYAQQNLAEVRYFSESWRALDGLLNRYRGSTSIVSFKEVVARIL